MGKTKDFFQEVGVDVRIPVKCSTNKSLGKNPTRFNPTNQTINIEKFLRILILERTYENPLNQRDPQLCLLHRVSDGPLVYLFSPTATWASTRRYRTRADKAACGLVDRSTKQYTELYADTVSV